MIYLWVVFILFGFLFGSLLFSKIIPKLFLGKDVTALAADKNPGAGNVFVKCGILPGFICLFLDMLKGFLPVFLATYFLNINNLWFSLVIFAPAFGHGLGLFNSLHGGKCIATIFGTMIALLPHSHIGLVLAVIYVVFSTLIKISPNSRRSIITFSLFMIFTLIILIPMKKYSIALGCVLLSLLSIVKHLMSPNKLPEKEKIHETC